MKIFEYSRNNLRVWLLILFITSTPNIRDFTTYIEVSAVRVEYGSDFRSGMVLHLGVANIYKVYWPGEMTAFYIGILKNFIPLSFYGQDVDRAMVVKSYIFPLIFIISAFLLALWGGRLVKSSAL